MGTVPIPQGASVVPMDQAQQQAQSQAQGQSVPIPAGATVQAIPEGATIQPLSDEDKFDAYMASDPDFKARLQHAANQVGGAAVGFGKSALQTVKSIVDLPDTIMGTGQQTHILPSDKTLELKNDNEKAGGLLEGIAEFATGDEALKGLSLSERLGLATKLAKLAEDHPIIAKLINAGLSSVRQGTVGGAQTLAHGGTGKEAAESAGLTAGLSLPFNAAAELTQQGAKALNKNAEQQYSKVLSPTTAANKERTAKFVPQLLKRGVTATSRENLENQIAQKIEESGKAVDDAIDAKVAEGSNPRPGQLALPEHKPEIETGVQQIKPTDTPGKLVDAERVSAPAQKTSFANPEPGTQFLSGSAHPEMSGELTNPGTFQSGDKAANAQTLASLKRIAGNPDHFGSFTASEQDAILKQIGRLQELQPNGKAVESGPIMSTEPIMDHLEGLKKKFVVNGAVVNQNAYTALNKVQGIVARVGDNISLQSMRRLRQVLDQEVDEGGGFFGKSLKETSLLNAKLEAANAIRNEFGKQFPDIAKLNSEFSMWANVGKVLNDTALRKTGQESLSRTMMKVAGSIVGDNEDGILGMAVGNVAAGAINNAVKSTAWRTISAVNKARLAHSIVDGNGKQVLTILRKAIPAAVSATESTQGNENDDNQ